MLSVDKLVRLPRSSHRASRLGYIKLLTRINDEAPYGFAFEGTLLPPGKTISWEDLSPQHPKTPLLLECAGTQNPMDGRPSKRNWPTLYILWKFDQAKEDWTEVARSCSESWDWAADLKPIAKRLLLESQGGIEVFRGAEETARVISETLRTELGRLSPLDRRKALGILHDHFCTEFARL